MAAECCQSEGPGHGSEFTIQLTQCDVAGTWSALTCQRFGQTRTVASTVRYLRLNNGSKPPQTKAATGRRTPKSRARQF